MEATAVSRSPPLSTAPTPTLEPPPDPGPEAPSFVFPARNPRLSMDASMTSSSAASIATRTRPARLSIGPLPPFNFPPSPSPSTPSAFGSGEPSPIKSTTTSPRPAGHRRSGSELIGGAHAVLAPSLLASSPGKAKPASPLNSARSRGHAHRRSGAISQHDLSHILKPGDPNRRTVGSAPATPSDTNQHRAFVPTLDRAASQPCLPRDTSPAAVGLCDSPASSSPPASPTRTADQVTPGRPRVGFSDRLEFIPRPLSTISSATSSSMSTIRPSHSLTGSISSFRSLGTASPPSARKSDAFGGLLSSPAGLERTASDASDSPSTRRLQRPATPPSTRDADEKSTTNDPFETPEPAVRPPPRAKADAAAHLDSDSLSTSSQRTSTPPLGLPLPIDTTDTIPERPRSSPEAGASKRQRKPKFVGGLLSRIGKPKPESSSPKALEASDTAGLASLDEFSLEDINFDEDTTCVIRDPSYQTTPGPRQPERTSLDLSDEEPEGVLDLDATWDEAELNSQRRNVGVSPSRRRVRPRGNGASFVHRRAESAPALAPFEYRSAAGRLNNSMPMADVFEEEEEEVHDSTRKVSQTSSKAASVHTTQSDVPTMSSMTQSVSSEPDGTSANSVSEMRSGKDLGEDLPSEATPSPLRDIASPTDSGTPSAVPSTDSRSSVLTKSSDGSTVTPKSTEERPPKQVAKSTQPDTAATLITVDEGHEKASTSHPISSSFEAPRLDTAHSSTTDRSTWSSPRVGDSSGAVSTKEEVPSLTSSASTAASHIPPFTPLTTLRASATRSISLSNEVARGAIRPSSSAGKRASLVSLSRLMGGANGDKSKLSLESSLPDSEPEVATEQRKKRGRIGRLVRFWRSRDIGGEAA